MSDKVLKAFIAEATKGNMWLKLADPSVARGKTAFPKLLSDQERLGIRVDYDKVVTKDDGTEYHLYKMQANVGKIPSSIKVWREKHGTDAVMAEVWVKKEASAEEVKGALEAAREAFKRT